MKVCIVFWKLDENGERTVHRLVNHVDLSARTKAGRPTVAAGSWLVAISSFIAEGQGHVEIREAMED